MTDREKQIERTVLQLASEILEIEPDHLSLGAHMVNELGASSVALLEFSVALERRFGVSFEHREFVGAERLVDVVGLVARGMPESAV